MSKQSYSNEIDIVGKLTKIIPNIRLLIILDKKGNLLSYLCSEDCANDHDLTHIRNLAKLVSIRYRIGDFDKLMEGLETTINVFKNKTVFVRGLQDDNILVVVGHCARKTCRKSSRHSNNNFLSLTFFVDDLKYIF